MSHHHAKITGIRHSMKRTYLEPFLNPRPEKCVRQKATGRKYKDEHDSLVFSRIPFYKHGTRQYRTL